MLVPAILYKNEIENKSKELCYSDQAFYYGDGLGQNKIYVEEEDQFGELFQYAILNSKKELIGYFRYRINWYNSCAHAFGLINLTNIPQGIIGIDVRRELKKIINKYKVHRIEFRMIGGNPVECHYKNFTKKHNGKIFTLTDAIKDREGLYHDDVIYEIICDKKGDIR